MVFLCDIHVWDVDVVTYWLLVFMGCDRLGLFRPYDRGGGRHCAWRKVLWSDMCIVKRLRCPLVMCGNRKAKDTGRSYSKDFFGDARKYRCFAVGGQAKIDKT
jgi:hypothetical protein